MSTPSLNPVEKKRKQAQRERMRELAASSTDSITSLLESIRTLIELRAPESHLYQHRALLEPLGVDGIESYLALLVEHLARTDLHIFTYITSVGTRDRMWILVAIDNGVVAMYNESKRRMWSLYRHEEPHKYLESGRGWWIHARLSEEDIVEFQSW